jgi:phage-related tail protein
MITTQHQQEIKYLRSQLEQVNKQIAEDKKRAQLENIIPINRFINQTTGQLNEQALDSVFKP